ncbi:MAG: hypothetical protein ABJB03_06195 [Rhodoglobus sp.]
MLVRPFVRVWLVSSADSWRALPRPIDSPEVRIDGPTPDRILLLGAGIGVGYNVLSHQLGLGGRLARVLTDWTSRGTEIDIVVDPDMTVPAALQALERIEVGRFDAVLLTLGGLEALELMPRSLWRKQMTSLLDAIEANAPASLQVLLVGAPPIPSINRIPRLLVGPVTRRARLLNDESRALIEGRPNCWFVDFVPRPGDLASRSGRRTYLEWAELIAPQVVVALNSQAPRHGA